MKMLFLEGTGRTQVRVESFSMVTKGNPGLLQTTAPELEYVSALRQQLANKNRGRESQKTMRKTMRKTVPKSSFLSALSSLSIPGVKTDKLERTPPEKKPMRPFQLRMSSSSSK